MTIDVGGVSHVEETPDRNEQPLWGKTTQLALANSPEGGLRLSDLPDLVRALAEVKIASALANRDHGDLDSARANAIVAAAREVAEGRWSQHLPLRVIANGGATSTNMNVNEVVAARASQILADGRSVHPNDHVNRAQSTNDVYPTAARIVFVRRARTLASSLRVLAAAFDEQGRANLGALRLGRTAWQDAVRVPVADAHRAQGAVMRRLADSVDADADALLAVPLGGTVLGTGAGAPQQFAATAIAYLAAETTLPVTASSDRIDAVVHLDRYAALAGSAARAASILAKIGNDLRILSSGPNGGLGELDLAALQPGSSIMPGKVNPVAPSFVVQSSFSVRAAASAVDMAVAAGDPDFNSYTPSIVAALCPALNDLIGMVTVLTDCVERMTWNHDRIAVLAAASLDERVEIATSAGYDATTARAEASQPGHPGPDEKSKR